MLTGRATETKNPPTREEGVSKVSIQSLLSQKEALRLFGLVARGANDAGVTLDSCQWSSGDSARLKELVSSNLVQTKGSNYTLTALGKEYFRKQIELLRFTLVENTGKHLLQLSDEQKNPSRSPDVLAQTTTRCLLEDLQSATGLKELKPVKVFSDWLNLSMQTAMLLENMREEIYVATKYMDFRTAEIALNAAKLGRRINILHCTRDCQSTKLQLLGNLMSNPRAAKIYSEFSRHTNISAREGAIPYSYVIFDRTHVEIEIVNPRDPDSFFLAYLFENPLLAEKLIWLYNDSFVSSQEDKLRNNLEEAAKTKTPRDILTV
ncbi:MAG: hypothetical protein ACHQ1H_09920 [Nitrososphaerales archaeon]